MGELTAEPEPAEAVEIVSPPDEEEPLKIVTAITEALQAGTERPPRPIWLPVLGDPTPARRAGGPLAGPAVVCRLRQQPGFVDAGGVGRLPARRAPGGALP